MNSRHSPMMLHYARIIGKSMYRQKIIKIYSIIFNVTKNKTIECSDIRRTSQSIEQMCR